MIREEEESAPTEGIGEHINRQNFEVRVSSWLTSEPMALRPTSSGSERAAS